MTTYSFLVRYDEEPTEGLDLECASPTAAIHQARSFLAEMVENHSEDIAEASVTVGEGSLFEDDSRVARAMGMVTPSGLAMGATAPARAELGKTHMPCNYNGLMLL